MWPAKLSAFREDLRNSEKVQCVRFRAQLRGQAQKEAERAALYPGCTKSRPGVGWGGGQLCTSHCKTDGPR